MPGFKPDKETLQTAQLNNNARFWQPAIVQYFMCIMCVGATTCLNQSASQTLIVSFGSVYHNIKKKDSSSVEPKPTSQ